MGSEMCIRDSPSQASSRPRSPPTDTLIIHQPTALRAPADSQQKRYCGVARSAVTYLEMCDALASEGMRLTFEQLSQRWCTLRPGSGTSMTRPVNGAIAAEGQGGPALFDMSKTDSPVHGNFKPGDQQSRGTPVHGWGENQIPLWPNLEETRLEQDGPAADDWPDDGYDYDDYATLQQKLRDSQIALAAAQSAPQPAAATTAPNPQLTELVFQNQEMMRLSQANQEKTIEKVFSGLNTTMQALMSSQKKDPSQLASCIKFDTLVRWTTLGDDAKGQDTKEFFRNFEANCKINNGGRGMQKREMLIALYHGLEGSKKLSLIHI